MKTRVLSALMAAVLLLLALPLSLPSVAAEPPVFEAKDYDALYVQSGLTYAIDFFGSNAYWGGTSADTADINEGAALLNAYRTAGTAALSYNGGKGKTVIRDGYYLNNAADTYQLLLANVDNQMALGRNGATMETVATMATTSLGASSEHLFVFNNIRFLAKLVGGKVTLNQIGIQGSDASGLLANDLGITLSTDSQTTYTLTVKRPTDTQNYYTYHYKLTGAEKPTADQYSAAVPDSGSYFYITHTATYDGDTVTGVTPIAQLEDLKHKCTFFAHKPVYAEFGGKKYIVGSQVRAAENVGEDGAYWHDVSTDPGHLGVYEDGKALYTNDAVRFPNNAGLSGATYWRLWGQGSDMQTYAVRYYSRILTADEMAANHLADLCKWFRLDISRYQRLSSADRATVARAFTEYDFTADKAALQSLLNNEADAITYDPLLEGVTVGSEEHTLVLGFLATAKEYLLDINDLKTFPAALRIDVYRTMAAYSGEKTSEALQEALDAAVKATLEFHYGDYIDSTVYDYRDIYVRQDKLYLAVDYFDATAADGNVYVGVSYDSWEEKYTYYRNNWASIGADEGGPFATQADAIQYARDHRAETQRPNNWEDMTDRYLWHGSVSSFQALDISDRNYPHTNIRTYGDGRLICTTNNSLLVKFENDLSDVTYQVVSKVTGSPNWQLRGFRVGMSGTATGFSATSMTYQAFGVTGTATKPVENQSALYSISIPREERVVVPMTYSTDITVVADKNAGADLGHYYHYEFNEETQKYDVTEVATAQEANSPLITYYGRLDLSVYGNGTYLCGMQDVSFMSGAPDSIGNSGANEFFAVRVYSCALTPEEIRQNHFADLAGYYDLDLSLYYRLTPAERATLHAMLASLELGAPDEEAIALYEGCFAEIYYRLAVESENAETFRALAEQYKLDITSLRALSPLTQERVFGTFAANSAYQSGNWFSPVLQGELEREIDRMVEEHYAESRIHTLTTFANLQLKKRGDLGMRALFRLNHAAIVDVLDAPDTADITVGMLVLPEAQAHAPLSVENGAVVLPEGTIASTVAYRDGDYTDIVFREGGVRSFACEFYPDDVNERVSFVAYVMVEQEEGEPILYRINVKPPYQKRDGISMLELTRYAKEKQGMAYENVQRLMNEYAEEEDVTLSVGAANISDYVILHTGANAAAVTAVQNLLEEYVGIRLKTVTAEELDGHKYVMTIGTGCDVVYEDPALYGVNAVGGALRLWYLKEANGEAAVALFAEYLSYARENGLSFTIAEGTDLVRRVR